VPSEQKWKTPTTVLHEIMNSDLPASEKNLDRVTQEVQTIAVAGMETTGAILTVITFFLLKNPEKLRTLQAELRTAIPDATSLPPHQQLEKLPYLVRTQDLVSK
jgi:cytochrome P450